MRVIKLGIISLIIFFIIFFLLSLLIPSTVRISRAINIKAPQSTVYRILADTSTWKNWNELKNDSISIQLISADSNLIHSKWTYGGRSLNGFYRIERVQNLTVVNWYFDIKLKWYPWEKFASITFEKQFGPAMEASLTKLEDMVPKVP